MSSSSRLHRELCQLLRDLPFEAQVPELLSLEHFLGSPSLHHALLPCYEMVFAQCDDQKVSNPENKQDEVIVLSGLSGEKGSQSSHDLEQEGLSVYVDEESIEPLPKRARASCDATTNLQVNRLYLSLHKRAMELQVTGYSEADVVSLSTLGAITCLLLRALPIRKVFRRAPTEALLFR